MLAGYFFTVVCDFALLCIWKITEENSRLKFNLLQGKIIFPLVSLCPSSICKWIVLKIYYFFSYGGKSAIFFYWKALYQTFNDDCCHGSQPEFHLKISALPNGNKNFSCSVVFLSLIIFQSCLLVNWDRWVNILFF